MPTELETAVEEFVASQLEHYEPSTPQRRRKAIHDALWGTVVLSPAEVAVLDCPLLQRLRLIHQTALAFYVYPSATHSRLEHSLGVVAVATKLVESLNAKKGPDFITPLQRQQLRLAALLHDCGHGLLSHVSEHFYQRHQQIVSLKKQPMYQAAKPHELLAYMIVRSKSFAKCFSKVRERYGKDDKIIASIDDEKLREIADMIIGRSSSPDKAYLSCIINGPFDADKLDYVTRDSYFTGLRLGVDIERLLYALDTAPVDADGGAKETRLVAISSAATVLEQILFSKIQLYPCLYHHAKVRATDTMLITFLEYVRDLYGKLKREGGKQVGSPQILLDSPTDFLRYTDYDLLNINLHQHEELRNIIQCLRDRRLPLKALVVSSITVEKNMDEITRLIAGEYSPDPYYVLDGLRKEIHSALPSGVKGTAYDIVVDFPGLPPLNEATLSTILEPNGKTVPLNSFFPTHDWLQTYVAKKWKGHVFCPAHMQHQVNKAAIEVLEAKLKVKFNNLATDLANLHQS